MKSMWTNLTTETPLHTITAVSLVESKWRRAVCANKTHQGRGRDGDSGFLFPFGIFYCGVVTRSHTERNRVEMKAIGGTGTDTYRKHGNMARHARLKDGWVGV